LEKNSILAALGSISQASEGLMVSSHGVDMMYIAIHKHHLLSHFLYPSSSLAVALARVRLLVSMDIVEFVVEREIYLSTHFFSQYCFRAQRTLYDANTTTSHGGDASSMMPIEDGITGMAHSPEAVKCQ
jgi:hypothetical protein